MSLPATYSEKEFMPTISQAPRNRPKRRAEKEVFEKGVKTAFTSSIIMTTCYMPKGCNLTCPNHRKYNQKLEKKYRLAVYVHNHTFLFFINSFVH